MTPANMAGRLRAALRQLATLTDNDAFYDDTKNRSFKFDETHALLDKHYPEPEFDEYEMAFIRAVGNNGFDEADAKQFLRCRTDPNEYPHIENGGTLMDHWVTFGIAYEFARQGL